MLIWIPAKQSDLVVLGPRGVGHAHKYYRPQDVQSLQIWEEKANTAIMVLHANIDVMQSLTAYYKRLRASKDFDLRLLCSNDIEAFTAQVNDMVHDFRTQIGRASDLVKVTKNRKELASICGVSMPGLDLKLTTSPGHTTSPKPVDRAHGDPQPKYGEGGNCCENYHNRHTHLLACNVRLRKGPRLSYCSLRQP